MTRARSGLVANAIGTAMTIATVHAAAPDWTQWRGPTRDGWVPAATAPAQWPETLTKRWTQPSGEGYSSPIVAGRFVFVHSRQDPDEVVTAFDLASGKVQWRQTYPAPFAKNPYATKMAKGPNSTPIAANDRLYTLGATAILTSFDASSGRVLWRKDFSSEIDTSKLFCGTAMSPAIDRGRLFVHVGDDRRGAVIAFDAASGQQRWRLDTDGPGYASPVIADIAGARQLVTLTDKAIVAIAVDRGALLWRIPFPDEWNENIVTPIVMGNRVIVSGVRQGTIALDVTRKGDAWQVDEAWRNRDVTMYLSSPVLDGTRLYGMSAKRKGQFFCLDAQTGRPIWTTEGRAAQNAALLAAGSHLLVLTTDGDLLVARRDAASFDPIRRYDVADASTWSHPALLAGGQILIRDEANLTLWSVSR